MAYPDAVALFQSRVTSKAPGLSVFGNSVLMNFATAFLSANQDTRDLITSVQSNQSVGTAQGNYLLAKAQDYNVPVSSGTPSVGSVVFSINPAPTSPITIGANTVVGTTGYDGSNTTPQSFVTQTTVTISAGSTSSASVNVVCTTNGSAGNVSSGAINRVITNVANGALTVTNASGTTGGTDADTPTTVRNNIYAATVSKYGALAVTAAILGVSGVYDAYVLDPQNGSGGITYYWCDSSGNQPGTIGTPGTLADTVDKAVRTVLPPNITPTKGTFTVYNPTNVAVTIATNTNLTSSTLQPLVETYVANYFNSLVHDQVPDAFSMGIYVQNSLSGIPVTSTPLVGGVLSKFQFTTLTASNISGGVATAPGSLPGASNTALYRLTGTPSTVVTVTGP